MKIVAAATGMAGGDAQAEASTMEMATADVAVIHHGAKIPQ
jgi:hypothetical protein